MDFEDGELGCGSVPGRRYGPGKNHTDHSLYAQPKEQGSTAGRGTSLGSRELA